MRRVRMGSLVGAVALTTATALVLPACGSDDTGSSGSPTSTTAAPEEVRTSAAKVAAGLRTIKATASEIAATVEADAAAAKVLNDKIEPAWEPIEGTLKANDQDAYITFEDNFALLGDAVDSSDATKAGKASDAIAAAADAYLAEYPG